jgi:hypothetical protein
MRWLAVFDCGEITQVPNPSMCQTFESVGNLIHSEEMFHDWNIVCGTRQY